MTQIQTSTHYKAFKYRLYPTKAQKAVLNEQLRLCRNLYNAALQERRDAYRKCGVSVSAYDQKKSLPEIKAALPEYSGVYSQVLQDVILRLDKAFKGFFRRVKAGQTPGYPRFQGRDRFDSLHYPQSGFSVSEKTAFFSKVGNIRIKLHRPIEGKIKTATVKREGDEWYVSYVCEVEAQPLPKTGSSVGVDVGTTWFAITSDGEFVENPRHYQKAMRKLRTAQRAIARKPNKRSNRRKKAVKRVAKIGVALELEQKFPLRDLSEEGFGAVRVAQGPELPAGDLIREREIIPAEHVHMLMQQRGQPRHILVVHHRP